MVNRANRRNYMPIWKPDGLFRQEGPCMLINQILHGNVWTARLKFFRKNPDIPSHNQHSTTGTIGKMLILKSKTTVFVHGFQSKSLVENMRSTWSATPRKSIRCLPAFWTFLTITDKGSYQYKPANQVWWPVNEDSVLKGLTPGIIPVPASS